MGCTEMELIQRIAHETDRIRQFELETGSTSQSYTKEFRSKILLRAKRCGAEKLELFVKVLEGLGYKELAIVAGQEAVLYGRYRREAPTSDPRTQPTSQMGQDLTQISKL